MAEEQDPGSMCPEELTGIVREKKEEDGHNEKRPTKNNDRERQERNSQWRNCSGRGWWDRFHWSGSKKNMVHTDEINDAGVYSRCFRTT